MTQTATRAQQALNSQTACPLNPDYYPSQNVGKRSRKNTVGATIASSETLTLFGHQDTFTGSEIKVKAGTSSILRLPPVAQSFGCNLRIFLETGQATFLLRGHADDTTPLCLVNSISATSATDTTCVCVPTAASVTTITTTRTTATLGGTSFDCYCNGLRWFVRAVSPGIVTTA